MYIGLTENQEREKSSENKLSGERVNGLTEEKEDKQLISSSEEQKTQSDRSKEPEPETAEDIAKQVCVACRMSFMHFPNKHPPSHGSHNNERESPVQILSRDFTLKSKHDLMKWQAKAKLTNFSSLVPRPRPALLQAMESWAGPGNEAITSVLYIAIMFTRLCGLST